MDMTDKPLIVGIGGTTRPNSSCERALRYALDVLQRRGARTRLFGASDLNMPHYAPEKHDRSPEAETFVQTIARADGIIIASPGYHGGVSGFLKNAIDYVEDLREAERPYFDGRAVGLIVSAAGWQATATTMVALRSIVHALRGWPTPLGICINSMEPAFDHEGRCIANNLGRQFDVLADQLIQFSTAFSAQPADRIGISA